MIFKFINWLFFRISFLGLMVLCWFPVNHRPIFQKFQNLLSVQVKLRYRTLLNAFGVYIWPMRTRPSLPYQWMGTIWDGVSATRGQIHVLATFRRDWAQSINVKNVEPAPQVVRTGQKYYMGRSNYLLELLRR